MIQDNTSIKKQNSRNLRIIVITSIAIFFLIGCATARLKHERIRAEHELKVMGIQDYNLKRISETATTSAPTPIPAIEEVTLITLDFYPNGTSNYNINWPGPPRRKLKWQDVKAYTPIISLDKNSPREMTLFFWIKADRTMWSDPTLGFLKVTIPAGSKIPQMGSIHYPSASGEGVAPQGAPPSNNDDNRTYDAFWLGCTKRGKVKGNEGKDK